MSNTRGMAMSDALSTEQQVAYRHTHMCIDVRGALRNYKASLWRGVVSRENGTRMTANEAREWLMDQLAMGRKVIPFGKPCDGFSYETGCPGHEGPSK